MTTAQIAGYVVAGVGVLGAAYGWLHAYRCNRQAERDLVAIYRKDLSDQAKRDQESAVNKKRQRTGFYLFGIAAVVAVLASMQADSAVLASEVVKGAIWAGVAACCGAAYYLMHWFMLEVWAELKRVVWPTKDETYSFTAVVIWGLVIVGFYMGMLDWICTSLIALLKLYG
jgi:preprotein translocase SecE subunit